MNSLLEHELRSFRQDILRAAQDLNMRVDVLGSSVADGISRNDAPLLGFLALTETLPELIVPIIQQLSTIGEQLGELTDLVANPNATRADELFRRAAKAFNHEWIEEAQMDAREAIKNDPYHYHAYYLLARTLAQQGRSEEAAPIFAKAARYSTPYEPRVSVSAALAGMQCYHTIDGGLIAAVELGRQTSAKLSTTCPQLILTTSLLSRHAKEASLALLAEPDLLPVAVAIKHPVLMEACEQMFEPLRVRVQQLLDLAEMGVANVFIPLKELAEREAAVRSDPYSLPASMCPRCRRCWKVSGAWTECSQQRPYYSSGQMRVQISTADFLKTIDEVRVALGFIQKATPIQVAAVAQYESDLFAITVHALGTYGYLQSDSYSKPYVQAALAPLKTDYENYWKLLTKILPEIMRVGTDACGRYL